jgi:polyferredoxin
LEDFCAFFLVWVWGRRKSIMFITNWLGRLWCGAILENDTLGEVYERNIIISIVGKGAFEKRLKDGISYSKACPPSQASSSSAYVEVYD